MHTHTHTHTHTHARTHTHTHTHTHTTSEFLRPTAKKYKEEKHIQEGADTDRSPPLFPLFLLIFYFILALTPTGHTFALVSDFFWNFFCKEEKLIEKGTDGPSSANTQPQVTGRALLFSKPLNPGTDSPSSSPFLSPPHRAMEHFDRNFDGRVSAEEMFTGVIFVLPFYPFSPGCSLRRISLTFCPQPPPFPPLFCFHFPFEENVWKFSYLVVNYLV
jgi:hypothetical protein